MEQFTQTVEGQFDGQDKVVLRLLPDLPSATILHHNVQTHIKLRLLSDLPSATIDVGRSGLVTGSDQPTATDIKVALAVSE